MASLIAKIKHKIIWLSSDHVYYKDAILPAKYLRFCGPKFRDDEYFFSSAQAEANRLIEDFGLTAVTCILDVGCGVGRLPIGIVATIGEIKYYRGIDVSKRSIKWCQRHITKQHANFQFIYSNVQNIHYNPKGESVNGDFRFPFSDYEFDIIYLYSVFSHMISRDIRIYLKEFQRLLAPSGKIFLTAFIENNVPDMTVNPQNYRMKWIGALHCVRYNKDFFESLLNENGFAIERFDYENETNGQSGLYIARK